MFAPLGALGAFGKGGVEGYTQDAPHIFEQMGLAALGKAFQPQQGPIDQMNQRAMAPPPGQASMPAQGQPQPASPVGGPGAPPPPQQQPPGSAMGGGAPQQGGMPMEAIAARIQQSNPGLPPQALVAALVRAVPLMNAEGRDKLLNIRRQMLGLSVQRAGTSQQKEQRISGQQGAASQSHEAVNPQTGQVIFWDQGRNTWVDKQTGQPLQQPAAQGSEAATP